MLQFVFLSKDFSWWNYGGGNQLDRDDDAFVPLLEPCRGCFKASKALSVLCEKVQVCIYRRHLTSKVLPASPPSFPCNLQQKSTWLLWCFTVLAPTPPAPFLLFLSEPVSLRYDKFCLLPVSWYNWKVSFHFKNVLSEEHLFLSFPMLTFNIITILLEHSQPDISRSTDPFFSKTAMRFDSLRRYLCICAVIQKEAYL